ncbi:MAG: hypothetical protein Q8Q88_10950 [Phenylobacterium sp.]|uniref:hypothetical protein n=1 Tax=Phenylobacterium sp. TaxID=1871053 RepID=UPI0027343CFB|nr:hypothetical protein [Phenylobacterium sp.]MDP3747549.1 hypothetical protein [Phenylobacterium sp.]
MLDIAGASGASYRFRRHQESQELPATAGNVIYVRRDESSWALVCCAEIDSLREAFRGWKEAQVVHQATDVFIRLNVSRAKRREECLDIVEKHQPPIWTLEADS